MAYVHVLWHRKCCRSQFFPDISRKYVQGTTGIRIQRKKFMRDLALSMIRPPCEERISGPTLARQLTHQAFDPASLPYEPPFFRDSWRAFSSWDEGAPAKMPAVWGQGWQKDALPVSFLQSSCLPASLLPIVSRLCVNYKWVLIKYSCLIYFKNILFTTNPLNMGTLNPKESPLTLIMGPLDPIFASLFLIFWHSFFRWWTHGRQAWLIKIIFQDFKGNRRRSFFVQNGK